MDSRSRIDQGLTYWQEFFFTPVLASSLSRFRIAHGLCLLLFIGAWWLHAREWLTTAGFHGLGEIMPPLNPGYLPYFGVLQFGSLLLFILGWKTRFFAGVTWCCLLYVTLVDRVAAYSINSIFLFSFLVLSALPFASRNGLVPIAPVRLLQLGMIAIYFSSGWHKVVYGDWLDSLHVLESTLKGIYMTDVAAWALRTLPSWFWTVSQYLVVAFELFSPVLFYTTKLRRPAILVGCVFHLGIAIFMDQLIFFSLQMMSFYFLFTKDLLRFDLKGPSSAPLRPPLP